MTQTIALDSAHAAARLLAAGFADGSVPMIDLPEPMRPTSEAQAYAIQRTLSGMLGPIGGWKVGAPGPDGPCSCAPLPAPAILHSPASLPTRRFAMRGVESEIGFRLATDLPPRDRPYRREEILAAIASAHPIIEVLQSRFADPDAVDPLCNLADLIQHGALVVGPPIAGWRDLDLDAMTVRQTATDTPDRSRTGNPAGDMMRLIAWLADTGAIWAGGLKANQIVTCGSWTGKCFTTPGGGAVAIFSAAEPVIVTFE